MPVGIRVSKPTIDALGSTSPNDFFLDTNYPLLKVHAFGTFSFPVAFGNITINHNLGYRPFVMVFSQMVTHTGSFFFVGDTPPEKQKATVRKLFQAHRENQSLSPKERQAIFRGGGGGDGITTVVTTEMYQHDWIIEGATVIWYGRTSIYTDRIFIEVGDTNVFGGGTVNGFYYIFKEET